MFLSVQHNVPQLQHLIFFLTLLTSPEHCLYPGNQFHDTEGLRNIIICPQIQSLDLVDLRGLRRDHDHRHQHRVLSGTQLFHNAQTILVRQHDV